VILVCGISRSHAEAGSMDGSWRLPSRLALPGFGGLVVRYLRSLGTRDSGSHCWPHYLPWY